MRRVAIYATHNRHGAATMRQKEKKADVWEQRVACMSSLMGCSDNMRTEVGGSEGGCGLRRRPNACSPSAAGACAAWPEQP